MTNLHLNPDLVTYFHFVRLFSNSKFLYCNIVIHIVKMLKKKYKILSSNWYLKSNQYLVLLFVVVTMDNILKMKKIYLICILNYFSRFTWLY